MTTNNFGKKMKGTLCLLLVFAFAFQIVPPVFAADMAQSVSLLDGLITITDKEETAVLLQEGEVTTTVTGFTSSAWDNTITITSNADYEAELKFSYIIENASSYEGFTSTSGVYTAIIKAGSEIKFNIVAAAKQTAKLTLFDFSLTEVSDSVNLTVKYDSALGSVTNGDATVAPDSFMQIAGGSSVTLTATPTQGYVFAGWVNAVTDELISSNASHTFTLAQDTTIMVIFARSEDPAQFSVGGTICETFESALVAAKTHYSKTVTLAVGGTLAAGVYDIPDGVKLLIPYSSKDDGEFDSGNYPDTSIEAYGGSQYAFRTLKLAPGTILNFGKDSVLNVNGRVYGKNGLYTGVCTDAYGCIELSAGAKINMNSGSKLYCYGYIIGNGEVTANDGSVVYEVFQMNGWRGGDAALAWKNDNDLNCFLFNDYAIQNIEADLIVCYGATAKVTATISAQALWLITKNAETTYIGLRENNSGSGLLQLESGASVRRSFTPATNRMEYTFSGNVYVAGINMTVKDLPLIGSISLNTAEYILAIPYYMDFVAADGSTVTLSNDFKLLPGATLTVEEGATAIVKKNLYVYDTADYVGNGYSGQGTESIPVRYVASTGATAGSLPTMNESTPSGQVIVNGTLQIDGAIYTTENGGTSVDKVIKGTGKIINNSTATAAVTNVLDEFTYSDGIDHDNIRVIPVVGQLAGVSGESEYHSFSKGTYYGLGDGWWYQYTISLAGIDTPVTVVPVGGRGVIVGSTATVIDHCVSGVDVAFQIFGIPNGCALYNGETPVTCVNGVYTISNVTGDVSLTLAQSTHTCTAANDTVYTVVPDCLHEAYSYQLCDCGCAVNAQAITAPGHDPVTDTGIAPTCTSFGVSDGSHCGRCGEILVEQERVARVSHNYVNDVCSVCEANAATTGPQYYWEYEDTTPVNVSGGSLEPNAVISGSVPAMEKPAVLKYDNPWEITWVGNHKLNSHTIYLSATGNVNNQNATYLLIVLGETGGIYLGQNVNGSWENYGVYNQKLTAYADKQDHTYTLRNVPNALGDGQNMIYLYVDGEQIGAMNQYTVGADPQNSTGNFLSGIDFNFTHLSASGYGLVGIKSLEINVACSHTFVTEGRDATCVSDGYTGRISCSTCGLIKSEGVIIPNNGGHKYLNGYCVRCNEMVSGLYKYQWNFTNGVIEPATGPCLETNGIKAEAGTTNKYYTLEKDIVLKANAPWQISWEGNHITETYYVLLCSRAGMDTAGTTYIFGGGSGKYGVQVGYYNSGKTPVNYGFMNSALADYAEGTHTYVLRNEFNGTKYQINLYIDGNLIGAMKNDKGEDANFDLTFGATGATTTFTTPVDFKNVTVIDDYNDAALNSHNFQENKATAVDSTCTNKGVIGEMICVDCHIKLSDVTERPLADHTYVNGACTKCGAKAPAQGGTYKWTFANAVPTNVNTTGFIPVVTTPGSTGTNKTYLLDKNITLNHTDAWEISWTGSHVVASHFMPLVSAGGYANGATYLFISEHDGVFLGYNKNGSPINFGIRATALTQYVDGKEHTYVLRNDPNGLGEGKSMVYLYVDGNLIGPMTTTYTGGNDVDSSYGISEDGISNLDFSFKQIGADSPFVMSDSFESLTIVNGKECKDTNYEWNYNATVPENVTGENLTANAVNTSNFALENVINLNHDTPWEITWVGNHAVSNHVVYLSSANNLSTLDAVYLLIVKGEKGGIYIGKNVNGKWQNYGVFNQKLTVYADGQDHTYTLRNVPDALGAGQNMVYLYVDGAEIGAMVQHDIGGSQQAATSNDLSGIDFNIAYMGASTYVREGIKSMTISIGAHTWVTADTTSSTCQTPGFSGKIYCSDCGYVKDEGSELPVVAHKYVGGHCEYCNEIEVGVGPFYQWDFDANGVPTNATGNCLTANGIKDTIKENEHYTFENDFVLRADKPWEVSWQGNHNTGAKQYYVLLSSRAGMGKKDTTYIFCGGDHGVNMGYYTADDGSKYVNYGFMTNNAVFDGYRDATATYTYTLRNEKVGDKYQVILYINGNKIGAMRNSSGQDVNFDLTMGATGAASTFTTPKGFKDLTVNLATADIEYGHNLITVPSTSATCIATGLTEKIYCSDCGYVVKAAAVIPLAAHNFVNNYCTVCHEIEAGEGPFYKWDFDENGVPTNVTGNCLTANGIKDTIKENWHYTFDKDIVLQADKPWEISWKGNHATDYYYVLLCSRNGMEKDGTTYIFGGQTYGVHVGYYNGTSPVNYGFMSSELTKYATGTHTYTIRNEMNGDKYQMNLYIDGNLIGAMQNKDHGVANFELTFGATGTHGVSADFYSPKNFTNVTVNEAIGATEITHTIVTVPGKDATCTSTGLTEGKQCSYCGLVTVTATVIPKVPHNIVNGSCTICKKNELYLALEGKYVSILGDSISTFNGVSHSSPFYPNGRFSVTLNDTWWMQVINHFNMNLCVNVSIGGSQVQDGSLPGVQRATMLHNGDQKPDIILIYLGINDLGTYTQYTAPGTVDYNALKVDGVYKTPANFAEAYAIMLSKMQAAYPDAQIFCVTLMPQRYTGSSNYQKDWNDKDDIDAHNECIRAVAAHYGVPVIDMAENSGITWDNYMDYMPDRIHPDVEGMGMMANCIINGMTAYYADGCIHSYDTEITEPTCTEKGYTTYTCACGDTYTEEIAVLGHDEIAHEAQAPTCTAIGWDAYVTCSRCDYTTYKEVAALGHTEGAAVEENRKESTCTVAGSYESVVYCSVCKTHVISRETKALELAAHTAGEVVVENEKAATCTAEGSYDNVVYCTICNAELSSTTVTVDMLAHSYIAYSSIGGDLERAVCEYDCGSTHTRVVESHEGNDVEVVPGTSGENNAEVTLETGLLAQIVEKTKNLYLNSDILDLIFDNVAVNKIVSDHQDNTNISVVVTNTTPEDVADVLRFDIYLKADGIDVAESVFGEGIVTVTIPLAEGFIPTGKTVEVWYVKDGADIEKMEHTLEGGKVTFQTNHFSEYEVRLVDEVVEPAVLYGDVNGDGYVTPSDATEILKYYTQIITEINQTVADVNGDGYVTPSDATEILKYYTGLITRFPVEGEA